MAGNAPIDDLLHAAELLLLDLQDRWQTRGEPEGGDLEYLRELIDDIQGHLLALTTDAVD